MLKTIILQFDRTFPFFYRSKLNDMIDAIPKSKKNKRCQLHSLDTHKPKPLGWVMWLFSPVIVMKLLYRLFSSLINIQDVNVKSLYLKSGRDFFSQQKRVVGFSKYTIWWQIWHNFSLIFFPVGAPCHVDTSHKRLSCALMCLRGVSTVVVVLSKFV